jgi:hypothetical protein
MSVSKYTITWVNDKPSESGKTVKVYLTHPDFPKGVTHFCNIPFGLAPAKWNTITADTIKFGTVETDYVHPDTGMTVELKNPRCQVSFFGNVSLNDGEALEETSWVDNRSKIVDSGDSDENFWN